MRFSLRNIVAPTTEPVTVEEVKLHSHISHSEEDDAITKWIKTARREAEIYQRRSFFTQEWQLSFDSWPAFPLLIPRPPLVTVDDVFCYDVDDNKYEFNIDDLIVDISSEPGRIDFAYGICAPTTILRSIDAVKINFTAGVDDVSLISPNIKDAIILYCTWQSENRMGETAFPDHFYNLLRWDRIYNP